jgi:Protein involved in formate dehydrogenase formation
VTTLSATAYGERRRRVAELATEWPFARQVLMLYEALLGVQEGAHEQALAAGLADLGEVPAFCAQRVMPGVVEATVAAGPEPLVTAAQALLYGGDLGAPVARWLAGEELDGFSAYFARAAGQPVLEALAERGTVAGLGDGRRRCPACGGLPQLAYHGLSDDPLLTAPRRLLCSRCSTAWPYPRMVCAGCGEADTSQLQVYGDSERFPHLRVDACDVCTRYLVTVELSKQPAAVPLVDELAALPLDLYARERGVKKIVPNLVGF